MRPEQEPHPPVNVAIIGLGRMGLLYGRIALESPVLRLVAGCGNTAPRCIEAGKYLGVPVYANGDYRTMFQEHPEINAVIVVTPEWLHVDPVIASLAAGKHVLLEKPMASSEPETQAIASAVRRSDRVFMLCHSVRFDPRYALAREAVARGDIGQVVHLYARRNADRVAAQRVLGKFDLTYWLMPHDVDIMRWITGQEVTEVRVTSGSGGNSDRDFLIASLKFSGGATGVIENSWASDPVGGRPRNGLLDIQGSHGSIEVSPYEQGLVVHSSQGRAVAPDAVESPLVHNKVTGSFTALVHHFADCIIQGRPPLVGLDEGLATMKVSAAMSRSLAHAGEPVSFTPV